MQWWLTPGLHLSFTVVKNILAAASRLFHSDTNYIVTSSALLRNYILVYLLLTDNLLELEIPRRAFRSTILFTSTSELTFFQYLQLTPAGCLTSSVKSSRTRNSHHFFFAPPANFFRRLSSVICAERSNPFLFVLSSEDQMIDRWLLWMTILLFFYLHDFLEFAAFIATFLIFARASS